MRITVEEEALDEYGRFVVPDGVEEAVLDTLFDLRSLGYATLPSSLRKLCIKACHEVISPPLFAEGIEDIGLFDLPNLADFERAVLPRSLKRLAIRNCYKVTSLPPLAEGIEEIDLGNLSELVSLGGTSLPPSLKKLTINNCRKVTSLPLLTEKIEEISLSHLFYLEPLGSVLLPRSLKKLVLDDCFQVTSLPSLAEGVEEIRLFNLPNLDPLGDDVLPTSLKKLFINDCPKVKFLPKLSNGIEMLVLFNLPDLEFLRDYALPANLQELWVHSCPKVTSLPSLPEGLRLLDISTASALRFTPELVEQLQALEAKGCEIHYPRHYVDRDSAAGLLQRRMEDAVEIYHSTHPEYTGQNLVNLTHRYLTESVGQRDTVPDLIRALEPVVAFAEEHSEHLGWMEEMAAAYQHGCVNQPVAGHGELCAWIAVASETTMTGKVEAVKQLLALEAIKQYVVQHFNSSEVEVEAGNALLREVHARLLKEGVIAKPWTGVPNGIAYEGSVRSFITDERVQEAVVKVKKEALDQPVDRVVSFLCTTHAQSYWSAIALDSDALHAKRKEVDGKFATQEEACEILVDPSLTSDKDKMREAEDRRCGREFRELLEARCQASSEVTFDEFSATATQQFMQRKEAEYGQALIDMTQELLAQERQPGNVLGGCGVEKGVGATKMTSISD